MLVCTADKCQPRKLVGGHENILLFCIKHDEAILSLMLAFLKASFSEFKFLDYFIFYDIYYTP